MYIYILHIYIIHTEILMLYLFYNINDILCVCTPHTHTYIHIWRGNKTFSHAVIVPGGCYETIAFMTQISSLVTTVVMAV